MNNIKNIAIPCNFLLITVLWCCFFFYNLLDTSACCNNSLASRPSIESQTNEDEIEVQTETLSLKATPLENGVVKSKTGDDTTDETYQNWYKAVYMPATEPETKAAASTSNSGK